MCYNHFIQIDHIVKFILEHRRRSKPIHLLIIPSFLSGNSFYQFNFKWKKFAIVLILTVIFKHCKNFARQYIFFEYIYLYIGIGNVFQHLLRILMSYCGLFIQDILQIFNQCFFFSNLKNVYCSLQQKCLTPSISK